MKLVSRVEARALGAVRYFTGIPCKRGHVAERYTRGAVCAECAYATHKAWESKNRDKVREKQAKHRAEHLDRVRKNSRERNWRFKGLPVPTRPCPASCENCNRTPRIALNLDHCHKTGKFRGWLCWDCNSSIGKLGDDLDSVERAAAYLRRAAV